MEVLFKGPLNAVLEAIKCNYVVYWSGDHGMDLVDKWTTEGKINDWKQRDVKHLLDTFSGVYTPPNQQTYCSGGT